MILNISLLLKIFGYLLMSICILIYAFFLIIFTHENIKINTLKFKLAQIPQSILIFLNYFAGKKAKLIYFYSFSYFLKLFILLVFVLENYLVNLMLNVLTNHNQKEINNIF